MDLLKENYDTVFIDLNPSFSIYTQIALSTTDFLIIPVMSDNSSIRAIKNALSLIYGLKLPSDIYLQYMFSTKLENAGHKLPQVHLILKNRMTQYMGEASAYATVLQELDDEIENLIKQQEKIFSFRTLKEGLVSIRDFQTTGVVAFARGCPFYALNPGAVDLRGKRIQITKEFKDDCIKVIEEIFEKLE